MSKRPLRSSTAKSRVAKVILPITLGLVTALSAGANADDWPHWRGPQRNGLVEDASGFKDGKPWPGPAQWQVEIGEGASAPVVIGDRVYAMGWEGGQDHLVALDASTGKEIWKVSYVSPRYGRLATGDQGLYSGPTSAIEFDPDSQLLFSLSCDGSLRAWNTEGELQWHHELHEEFNVLQRPKVGRSGHRDYGFTTSPCVWNDWLIVEVGSEEALLVAFDKSSGQEAWRSKPFGPAGHTGGLVPFQLHGESALAVLSFEGLNIFSLEKANVGSRRSHFAWKTEFANSIATPAIAGNRVLLTAEYNQHRIACVEIAEDGEAKLAWEQEGGSKVCSPVIKDEYIYWAWRNVVCQKLSDGELVWRGGRTGDAGSIIATSDGYLLVWFGRGQLQLIADATRSPEEYQVVAETPVLGTTDAWSHVVLGSGTLVCKDRSGKMTCYKISSQEDSPE